MADRIIVSTEEMRQTVSKYEAARDVMNQAFNNLNAAHDALDACWEGPAKLAYTARWMSILANLVKANQAIEQALTGLNETIAVQEQTEGDVNSKNSNLDVGTTPPGVF